MIRIRVEQPVERNDIMFNHAHWQSSGESTANLAMVIGDPVSESNGNRLSTALTLPKANVLYHVIPALGSYRTFSRVGHWRILVGSREGSSNSGSG